MNFVRLGALALLASVGLGQHSTQRPSKVVIEGVQVPASALRFVTGAPLVSCLWLDKNVSSLNCELFSSSVQIAGRTHTTTTAYISENAEPLEGRRDATGCCAEQRRYVRFENAQLEHGRFGTDFGESPLPMFEIGALASVSSGMSVPKGTVSPSAAVQFTRVDAFVPLRDVALYLRMPWQASGNKLSVGSSAGFKRTLEVVETGGAWQARIASRYFKFQGELPKDTNQSGASFLIWPQGRVKQVFYVYGKTLVFLEFRDRHWQISYRARLKFAPVWLCSPSSSNSQPAGFWAAVGGIEHETGRRPIVSTPSVKHAACSAEAPEKASQFRETQFFSVMQTNGLDQPKLWLALSIFDPQTGGIIVDKVRVIDLKTRQLTNRPAPETYDFMSEQRVLRR